MTNKLRALVDGLSSFFVTKKGNNTIHGNLYPAVNGTLDIGSSTLRFNNIYANNLIGVPAAPDELVKINAGDASAGYLTDKLLVGTNLSKTVGASTITLDIGSNVVLNTRAINTTAPLTGGGNLSGDRTLAINFAANSGLFVDSGALRVLNYHGIARDSYGLRVLNEVTRLAVGASGVNVNLAAGGGLQTSSGLGVDTTVVRTTRTINTTAPIIGGGDLSANRTIALDLATNSGLTTAGSKLAVGAGTLITVSGSTVSLSNGSAQYQVPVTGSTPFTPSWTNLSTFAGNGLSFSSGQFVIGAGTLISVGATTVGLSNGSAQHQVPVTGSTPFTPSWTGLSTFAGNGINFTAGQFVIEAGTLITVGANNVSISNSGSNYQFIASAGTTTPIWRNISELAGDGLNVTNGILRVDSTTLTVSANAVDLPLPLTITTSTSNTVGTQTPSVIGHSHAIDATNDVSTAPNQNKILRDASGALILASLQVHGSISIIGGAGDLTVGNDVLFVNNSGLNVGINMTPDPQFALDVNGPLRATYLVGKLAMQLNGITSLWQFDGPEPSPTLTGETRNHMGLSPTSETGVTFTYGKFGKAIQTPIATTNLITNPSFETGTSGWANYVSSDASGTRTRVTDFGYVGTCSYEIKKTSGSYASRFGVSFTIPSSSIVANTTYTFSAWINIVAMSGGATQRVVMHSGGNAFGGVEQTLATISGVTDGWIRISGSRTTDADGGQVIVWFWIDNASTGNVYLDAVQVEAQSYATPYCDGTLGNGHFWDGVAHATTSQRLNAQLTYDGTNFINRAKGTIMAWCKLLDSNSSQMLWSMGGTWVRARLTSRIWDMSFNHATFTSTTVWNTNEWYHVAMTWNGVNVILYINGVEVCRANAGSLITPINNFAIGRYSIDNNYWWSGAIDNFAILNRAMPEKEIQSVYNTDAPVFAASSTFNFRATPRGLVWADDEGLWVKDISGNSVFGVFAGESPTKSWGNFTMQQGDIAFGTYGVSGGGWMYFDDDGASGVGLLEIGSGNKTIWSFGLNEAKLEGILNIGTNGELRQGTGTIGSNFTGLRIWRDNSTGVGEIAGYNNNVIQWNADTDGTLKAGAGNVVLSAAGISATQGTIGGWTLTATTLSATNLTFTSGNFNVAHILAGTGSTAGGINAANTGTDIIFWAGSTHTNRASTSAFRVNASGVLTATGAIISGAITANSGSIAGTLTVGGSGQIIQGTGSLGVDFTGLRIWNSGSVGSIAGYNNNVIQWQGSTSGKLEAGGGVVVLDSGGIAIAVNNSATAWNSLNSVKFVQSGVTASGMYGYSGTHSGDFNSLRLVANQTSRVNQVILAATEGSGSINNTVYLVAQNSLNNAIVELEARNASISNSRIRLDASRTVVTGALYTGIMQVEDTLNLDSHMRLWEQPNNPAQPTAGTRANVYMRSDKFVIQYNDGGTTRYKYLDLTGTGVTWTHTTVAP